MADRRALFIVNPAAGGGRTKRAQGRIRELLGARPSIHAEFAFSERPRHATTLAADAAAAGFDTVVAVGGDGTVHEVANGLLAYGGPQPALAVIPTGTGNDFAHSLGIPGALRAALEVAMDDPGTARAVDAGRCGDRYFVVLAGVGFAARVAGAVNAAPSGMKIGALPFVYYTLREVVSNRNAELSIELDASTRIRLPSFMVYVSNCRFSGGGMQICPEAVPDDGLLDVCVVGDASTIDVVRLLPRVFSGGHVGHPKVTMYRSRTVRVDGPPGVLVQADGEVIGTLPMEISVLPAALRVLTAR